jgi:Zn-dependent M28 family amino/carboxypeptidase
VRRPALLAAALATVGIAGCFGSSSGPSEPEVRTEPVAAKVSAVIRPADVRRHLEALQRIAERNGGHRAAGESGAAETEEYIVRELRAAGWMVHRQAVRFPFFSERATPVLASLRPYRDFAIVHFSGSGDLRARVRVLPGEGCSTAAFAPVHKGEIVVAGRGTCTFRAKALAAQRAGAGALVIPEKVLGATLGSPEGIRIPVLTVSERRAQALLQSGKRVRVRVETESGRRTAHNVIAETRRAPRTVMAGAHADGVGAGPGINDNGSGVAALLEIARRERRTPGLRLAFWAAEEVGLYGSRRYARSLRPADRQRISAYVNLDMVGSPNPQSIVYDSGNRVEEVLRRALPGPERELRLDGSSDHASLAAVGIPVGGYYTGAEERAENGKPSDPCYHRACDDAGNVNVASTARFARATRKALLALAR